MKKTKSLQIGVKLLLLASMATPTLAGAATPAEEREARRIEQERAHSNSSHQDRQQEQDRARKEERRRKTGQVVGTLLGGLLGSRFGKGDGRVVGAIAGAVAGGLIGDKIARNMNEEDRQAALETTDGALEEEYRETPYEWQGSHCRGQLRFVSNGYYGQSYCRQYRHEVWDSWGNHEVTTGYYCQGQNGWYREDRIVRQQYSTGGYYYYYQQW